MLSLHGFEVSVVCDNQGLPTHAPSVDGRIASGWVATEVGKRFAIRVHKTGAVECPQFRACVYVDGRLCDNVITSWSVTVAGMYTTPITFVPFQFAPLRITENADEITDRGNEYTGTLKVTISRRVQIASRPNMSEQFMSSLKGASTHEKDKKRILGGQSVITGPEEHVARLNEIDSIPYNPQDPDPFVTFVFKYRSHDYLLAEGIIPRLALLPKRRNEGGDEEDRKPAKRIRVDDVDEARNRIRQLKDELRSAEAALAEDLDLPPPTMKREPFPFVPGVTVDLTLSDDEDETGLQNKKRRRASVSVIDLTND